MNEPNPQEYIARLPGAKAFVYYVASLFAAAVGFLIAEAVLTDGAMWLTFGERIGFAVIIFFVLNAGTARITGKLKQAAKLQFSGASQWNLRETALNGAFAGLAVGAFPALGYILILPFVFKWGGGFAPDWVLRVLLMICLIPLSAAGLVAPGAVMMEAGMEDPSQNDEAPK